MEEREVTREIEDEVMEEEIEMREKEGCWDHWKSQIQLKQDCCIEKLQNDGNEWRNKRMEERVRRREEEALEICETGENILP